MTASPKSTAPHRAKPLAAAVNAQRKLQAAQQAAQARLQEQIGDSLDDLRRKQAQAQQQQMTRHRSA